ncbi:MAG: hypothetical protein M3346_02930 [Actinomycetota bacterium]|nr:hypothetical protein [Actinomycetota bacterium]
MFEVTRPFLFFEYFRIPNRTQGPPHKWNDRLPERHPFRRACGMFHWEGDQSSCRTAYWIDGSLSPTPLHRLPLQEYRIDSFPIYGRIIPDHLSIEWLSTSGGTWHRAEAVCDRKGTRIASIWREEEGSIFIPFDPAEIIKNFWTEAYKSVLSKPITRSLNRFALRSYYRFIRPALPRRTQILFRQRLSQLQGTTRFPRWPVETALQDFYALVFSWITAIAGVPVPMLSPWPRGYSWALALTHDVETSLGWQNIGAVRDLETELGYRSSWNLVPGMFSLEPTLIASLIDGGFEVGVHGLYHDGRDLESLAMLKERLPAIRQSAEAWGATGFRSPSTHRVWEWMPLLGFDYDSSYPDTDPFEPQPGGCCSLLPYFNDNLIELPITLPQDHTLFFILNHKDEALWVDKAQYIKEQNGMALLIGHPDYLVAGTSMQAYRTLLRGLSSDPTMWRALPRDISGWWRRRAASHLEGRGDHWEVVGPAADEAAIHFTKV